MFAESQEALYQLQRTLNGIDPAAAGAASATDETELRQLKEEVAVLHRVVAGEWHIRFVFLFDLLYVYEIMNN